MLCMSMHTRKMDTQTPPLFIMHLWHIQTFLCPAAVSTEKSCLMRHQGLSSCHIKWDLDTHTVQPPYWLVSVIHALTLSISICCSFPLCHYSCSQLYCHIHFLSVSFLSLRVSPSKCLRLPPHFSHNHLTPLRASAETSFTPQPSLWQQVPLALTAWPLSNQHLLGFIPLSSLPLFHLPPLPCFHLRFLLP